MPADPTLAAAMEYVKLFGSFAFGLAVLIYFIKHLKELRADDKTGWEKDKAKFEEAIAGKDKSIEQLQAAIVGLQNDYIKASLERTKIASEAQVLLTKATEINTEEFKELKQRIEELIKELTRVRVASNTVP